MSKMIDNINATTPDPKRAALVIGSTGLTAQHLLNALYESTRYHTIYGLQRRSTHISSHYTSVICDFDYLDEYDMCFDVDDVYCCLGTTIKAAGSKEAFKTVDVDYVSKCAELAKAKGVKNFIVISATDANVNSVWFYNRMKGQMEQQLVSLFTDSEARLHICRPSLLIGQRTEKRFGEQVAQTFFTRFSFIWRGFLSKYRPIEAEQLASAMMKLTATQFTRTINIHENDQLIQLAKANDFSITQQRNNIDNG